jgi:hypothetical protein
MLVARLASPDRQFFLLVQQALTEKAIRDSKKFPERPKPRSKISRSSKETSRRKNIGLSDEDLKTRVVNDRLLIILRRFTICRAARDRFQSQCRGTKNVKDFVSSLPTYGAINYISTVTSPGAEPARFSKPSSNTTPAFAIFTRKQVPREIAVEKMKTEFRHDFSPFGCGRRFKNGRAVYI